MEATKEKRALDLVIRIAMKHDREDLMKDGYSSEEIDKAEKHYWKCEEQNQRMLRENAGIYHNGETN
jgi:hypothetical protein